MPVGFVSPAVQVVAMGRVHASTTTAAVARPISGWEMAAGIAITIVFCAFMAYCMIDTGRMSNETGKRP